ncbi:MAG: hypothetical protein IIC70_08885 [Acidobacteria bacterium]|nr:hypothetical protein [Acidobacteriota bacterium]
MAVPRITAVFLLMALSATACTSVDGDGAGTAANPLSVHEYASTVAEIMTRAGSGENYPIGGSTVRTATIFLELEKNLADLKAVSAPSAIRVEHSEVIARIEAVQDEVARYLQQHGVRGDDISLNDISFDADISPLILEARTACIELGAKLDELGEIWSLGICLV